VRTGRPKVSLLFVKHVARSKLLECLNIEINKYISVRENSSNAVIDTNSINHATVASES
jgi:hypothetical protein